MERYLKKSIKAEKKLFIGNIDSVSYKYKGIKIPTNLTSGRQALSIFPQKPQILICFSYPISLLNISLKNDFLCEY